MSSGEPAPGIEVRIVDPETLHVLAEDQVGEIWLRSASVASGYHNRPAETIERFQAHTSDGERPYLRTGDLGLLHESELYVTGRLKDLLIVNGRNLYPQDIEEFVQDVHPAVAGSRGCVISVDVDDAERLVLIQAVKTELLGDTSFDELAAAVKSAVARAFEVPAPGRGVRQPCRNSPHHQRKGAARIDAGSVPERRTHRRRPRGAPHDDRHRGRGAGLPLPEGRRSRRPVETAARRRRRHRRDPGRALERGRTCTTTAPSTTVPAG